MIVHQLILSCFHHLTYILSDCLHNSDFKSFLSDNIQPEVVNETTTWTSLIKKSDTIIRVHDFGEDWLLSKSFLLIFGQKNFIRLFNK